MSRVNPATCPFAGNCPGSMRSEKRERGGSRTIAFAARPRMRTISGPAKAGRRRTGVGSVMHAFPPWIEEYRLAHLHLREAGRRGGMELASVQLAARFDERQGDRVLASGAPVARRDMAERAHRHRLRRIGYDLRAL